MCYASASESGRPAVAEASARGVKVSAVEIGPAAGMSSPSSSRGRLTMPRTAHLRGRPSSVEVYRLAARRVPPSARPARRASAPRRRRCGRRRSATARCRRARRAPRAGGGRRDVRVELLAPAEKPSGSMPSATTAARGSTSNGPACSRSPRGLRGRSGRRATRRRRPRRVRTREAHARAREGHRRARDPAEPQLTEGQRRLRARRTRRRSRRPSASRLHQASSGSARGSATTRTSVSSGRRRRDEPSWRGRRRAPRGRWRARGSLAGRPGSVCVLIAATYPKYGNSGPFAVKIGQTSRERFRYRRTISSS